MRSYPFTRNSPEPIQCKTFMHSWRNGEPAQAGSHGTLTWTSWNSCTTAQSTSPQATCRAASQDAEPRARPQRTERVTCATPTIPGTTTPSSSTTSSRNPQARISNGRSTTPTPKPPYAQSACSPRMTPSPTESTLRTSTAFPSKTSTLSAGSGRAYELKPLPAMYPSFRSNSSCRTDQCAPATIVHPSSGG